MLFQKMYLSTLVIFDDILADKKFMKESEMLALLTQGRHS